MRTTDNIPRAVFVWAARLRATGEMELRGWIGFTFDSARVSMLVLDESRLDHLIVIAQVFIHGAASLLA